MALPARRALPSALLSRTLSQPCGRRGPGHRRGRWVAVQFQASRYPRLRPNTGVLNRSPAVEGPPLIAQRVPCSWQCPHSAVGLAEVSLPWVGSPGRCRLSKEPPGGVTAASSPGPPPGLAGRRSGGRAEGTGLQVPPHVAQRVSAGHDAVSGIRADVAWDVPLCHRARHRSRGGVAGAG